MDWISELSKVAGGGIFGAAIYVILKLREMDGAQRRGQRADDRDDFSIVAGTLQQQLTAAFEREKEMRAELDEKDHLIRNLETKLNIYDWMSQGDIDPAKLRKFADDLEDKQGKRKKDAGK